MDPGHVLLCSFSLQESPVSHSDSELLQKVHRSENGQIGCLGVARAVIGFNCVLIDAPHGVSSTCPVEKPTVAAFALQPVGTFVFGAQSCFVQKMQQMSLNYQEALLRRRD